MVRQARVPRGACGAMVSVPPCVVAISRAIARPSPVPSLAAFVVKNGSVARAASSGVMPAPSSITSNATTSPSWRARTTIFPPSTVAWAALSSRFTSACSTRRTSHRTAGSDAASSRVTEAARPAKRCSTRRSAPSTISDGATRANGGASPRARSRNPRTMRPMCADWSRIASSPRTSRGSSARARSCSARPEMTPSGVEISCEMPMANVPMVAARVARSSLSSSLARCWDSSSSRASSSSLRCRRRATTPNAKTSAAARATDRARR
jgi:hypothetical protein